MVFFSTEYTHPIYGYVRLSIFAKFIATIIPMYDFSIVDATIYYHLIWICFAECAMIRKSHIVRFAIADIKKKYYKLCWIYFLNWFGCPEQTHILFLYFFDKFPSKIRLNLYAFMIKMS